MAGAAGVEPAIAGSKPAALTTWPRPKMTARIFNTRNESAKASNVKLNKRSLAAI